MTTSDATPTELVLVTGATGFVGGHVVRALADAGYRLAVLQNRTPLPADLATLCERVPTGDIRDPQVREAALDQISIVCHLSAYIPMRMDDLHEADLCNQINALAVSNFAEEAAQQGVRRFVHLSTANFYAEADSARTESDSVFPAQLGAAYFVSKFAGEVYLSNISKRTGMEVLILRVATPYGPGEPNNKVIPTFLRMAAEGKPLRMVNGGVTRFSYVHVADVAASVLNAVGGGDGGIYNIASGEHTSILELAQQIVALQGDSPTTLDIEPVAAGAFPGFAPLSIDKARRTWQFAPRLLATGLREYRDYLVEQGAIA
ncbi:NAD(P)-dependent oxidoreductase [Mycobacterium sp.]|uniref:NAD-dependent epimerase/dehydratase family protein n=1 Tax=Mycobacterium sp. TaxID=1785 RepID=UPI0012207957|nr:NAD(P)-dependent oxidoreductase [Mycobacterium sp.]TAM65980.1 MAG: NAD(P)-dependent oxidoreductase [Mycobacterium sp.]